MNFFENIIHCGKNNICPLCNVNLIDKTNIPNSKECEKCDLAIIYNVIIFSNNNILYKILHWEKTLYCEEAYRLLIYYKENNIYFSGFKINNHKITETYCDFYVYNYNHECVKSINSINDLYNLGQNCLKEYIFK